MDNQFLFLLIGLFVGVGLTGLMFLLRIKGINSSHENQQQQLFNRLEKEGEINKSQQTELIGLHSALAETKTHNEHMRKKLEEQEQQLIEVQEKLSKDFEHLANKILEEKSDRFTKINKENIQQILDPLKERIGNFEKQIRETELAQGKERSALREQLLQLTSLNQNLSREAGNLTKALKGDTKFQGNWGEMILEKILEKSGLNKGREYSIQESFTNDSGKRLQPDVLIHLPDQKKIIIDAKVSLTAYERFIRSSNKEEEKKYALEHITSLRRHITGLSKKRYQDIYDIKTPDFVLLFIPIEPAFHLAIREDEQLFNEAFSRDIVLVSTSTLLATLRTIASIWKHENQNRNVREIAEESGKLYDKFVSFVSDLEKIGKALNQGQQQYDAAINKLQSGKGNLISKAEKIKHLGAKTRKQIPDKYLEE